MSCMSLACGPYLMTIVLLSHDYITLFLDCHMTSYSNYAAAEHVWRFVNDGYDFNKEFQEKVISDEEVCPCNFCLHFVLIGSTVTCFTIIVWQSQVENEQYSVFN